MSDLRVALENDSLIPCFQPLVELCSGKLIGFEVLARYQHPRLGLTLPSNFISLAEEHGLIGALTQQMLRKAFRSVAGMPSSLSLAVNVSPLQFRDRSLPKLIHNLAQSADFSLARLTIEITESAILDNVEIAREIAMELKAYGCRLALDDFGTGYSSLLHLQALPFDELKVDRSFVQSITMKRESRKIVAAVVGLGHSLGLVTVAEGVETEEQSEMLLRLGCAQGQGWLYGVPVVAELIPSTIGALARSATVTAAPIQVPFCPESFPTDQFSQLRAIYDGAPVGLCFLDTELRYVSINLRLADINGYSVRDHLGKTVAELAPKEFPIIEPHLRRALRGEIVSGVEVSHANNHSGHLSTFVASFQPAFDEAGEVVGILVAAAEITERKRAEEALRESLEHYQGLFDLSPHAPWVMDPQGNVTEVSQRWIDMTGLTREQSLGYGWLRAVHPDDITPRREALLRSLMTGTETDIEYRIRTTDGSWRWVRSRGRPCYGPMGEIVRWYGCLEDIDERRREHDRLLALLRNAEHCPIHQKCTDFSPHL